MGHKNIMHTVRYTDMAPDRFKNFWKDQRLDPRPTIGLSGRSAVQSSWSCHSSMLCPKDNSPAQLKIVQKKPLLRHKKEPQAKDARGA